MLQLSVTEDHVPGRTQVLCPAAHGVTRPDVMPWTAALIRMDNAASLSAL